jgi:hypothetical protein
MNGPASQNGCYTEVYWFFLLPLFTLRPGNEESTL